MGANITNGCFDHLGVGDGWEGVVDAGGGGGHGEQRGDGQHDAGGGGLVVQPEAHPGHAHRHEGRDVDREHVVRQLGGKVNC